MKKTEMKFYTSIFHKHGHKPVYEWLIENAKEIGVVKGSALKAVAGFGNEGELLEGHFFEGGSNSPVEVHLIVTGEQEKALIDLLKKEKLKVAYSRSPIEVLVT